MRELLVEAWRSARSLSSSALRPGRKANGDVATRADELANQMIVDRLSDWYPRDRIVSEEMETAVGPAGAPTTWFVDPIDGTRSFVEGRPGFSLIIASARRGRPEQGFVYDPTLRVFYSASSRGVISISAAGHERVVDRSEGSAAVLLWNPQNDSLLRQSLQSALGLDQTLFLESTSLRAISLLRGEGRLFTSGVGTCRPWDSCAAQVIVALAKGSYTDFHGDALSHSAREVHGNGALASRDIDHERACALARVHYGL